MSVLQAGGRDALHPGSLHALRRPARWIVNSRPEGDLVTRACVVDRTLREMYRIGTRLW